MSTYFLLCVTSALQQVNDLLREDYGEGEGCNLYVYEDKGNSMVKGLREVIVKDQDHVYQLIR